MSPRPARHDDYLEVRLLVPSQTFDLLCGALHEVNCLGFRYENEDAHSRIPVTAYFTPDVQPAGVVERLVPWLKTQYHPGTVIYDHIPDQDWDALWRSTYQPIEVGDDLVILPSWSTDQYTDRAVVRIKPERAFGTGSHETTRLCLDVLTTLNLQGARVADMGTGSGILAIAALKLGATSADACDPDVDALANARHNIDDNGVASQVTLHEGEMASMPDAQYDVILANLVLGPLRDNAPLLANRLAPKGVLLISGLLEGQDRSLESHLNKSGLFVNEKRELSGWILLVCSRSENRGPA
jgi:ribosomal protein L11 methyltransferase